MPTDFKDRLLPFTIRNAFRLRAYQDLWGSVDADHFRVSDLSTIPLMTKAIYRSSLMQDPAVWRDTAFLTHSTGTSGGITWRARSRSEVAILSRLLSSTTAEYNGFVLAFRSSTHGMALPVPTSDVIMPIQMLDDHDIEPCVDLLQTELPIGGRLRRAQSILGDIVNVALLSELVAERQLDTRIAHVAAGGPIDSGQVDRLAAIHPSAAMYNRFSVSEIIGGASRLLPNTVFRLDRHVIAEVIDATSVNQPPGDVGELVLTELFPFVQLQPLVRYPTGDLVRRVDDREGNFCFEWLGRTQDSLIDPNRGSWLIGSQQVAEVLGQQAMVARQVPRTTLNFINRVAVGPPKFTLTLDDLGTINLGVCIRTGSNSAGPRANRAIQQIWGGLRRTCLKPGQSLRLTLYAEQGEVRPTALQVTAKFGAMPLDGPPPNLPVASTLPRI